MFVIVAGVVRLFSSVVVAVKSKEEQPQAAACSGQIFVNDRITPVNGIDQRFMEDTPDNERTYFSPIVSSTESVLSARNGTNSSMG